MSNFYFNGSEISSVLIVGYGATGKSINDYLNAFKSIEIDVSHDDEEFVGFNLDEYDLIAVSPGIPLNSEIYRELDAYRYKVVSDIELFYQEMKETLSKTIAVTGSNGKSTVVTMLNYVLSYLGYKSILIGNIGIPALEELEKEFDFCVIELSSFQIDLLKNAKFDVGCVINVSPDHLDRYASFAEYKQSKLNLEKFSDEFIAYDVDCYGVKYDSSYAVLRENIYKDSQKILDIEEISLFGLHNLENIVVVLNILDKLNIDNYQAVCAIKTFKGLEHRCRIVEKINEVTFINDSKGTNVGATIAALNSITSTKNIILMLGGVAKGGDFSLMEEILKKYVKYVHIYGQDREYIEAQIKGFCNYELNGNMKQAFKEASEKAQLNDVILLSPACASFDEFSGYEERGYVFEKLVLDLQDSQEITRSAV
ncbi:MAG: UDP-N-acetylmuramoylalanine--D-glutamate ligase [Francisella sp.]|jgi:UDP-N-acetylmuramoylalanine--D-glutamate ligase